MGYLTEKCGEAVDVLKQVYRDFCEHEKCSPIFYESAGSRVLVQTQPGEMPSDVARRMKGDKMLISLDTLNTLLNK